MLAGNRRKCDVLVIGAGPAGTAAAILLAKGGWGVSIIEQHAYPRDKVCGGCIAAGNFDLLDELGVGESARRLAGAALKCVGWMRGDTSLVANMPPCTAGPDQFGRALGRDVFDHLLLESAASAGVRIFQPARVRRVSGSAGNFRCDVDCSWRPGARGSSPRSLELSASMVIDAHGSWERAPLFEIHGERTEPERALRRASDLFAFKASFAKAALAPGVLPVVALRGGYGGIVVGNDERITVAICMRRDRLRAARIRAGGLPAALAVEAYLRDSCGGIRQALHGARRDGSWLTVGPLRPGTRLRGPVGLFRVGNASGEAHPLIGEGISVALQSSKMLSGILLNFRDRLTDDAVLRAAQETYRKAWRKAFMPRLRVASLYAHVAMRAPLAACVDGSLRRWPSALAAAARLAGKGRAAIDMHI